MATDGSERSLLPPEGASQPFTWAAERVAPVLEDLHARIERITASPLPPESLRSLRYWFRTQHVFHSNAIEGSTLTLYETKVVVEDGLTVGGKPLRDVLAAKNLADALDWVEGLSTGAEPLSSTLIRQLHALVVRGEEAAFPGEYKRSENIVSGAIHRPPLRFQTAQLMASLGAYLTSATPTEDAIIESAIAHAWLVGIHPFQDGNGRTTRLLSNLVLRRRHSHFALLQNSQRAEYYQYLDEAHCTGDLTNFILLWCSCIDVVAQEYERLTGELAVRARVIEYAVARTASFAPKSRPPPLDEWNGAFAVLSDELTAVGATVSAGTEGRTSFRAEAVRIGAGDWEMENSPLLILKGQIGGQPLDARVLLRRDLQYPNKRVARFWCLAPAISLTFQDYSLERGRFIGLEDRLKIAPLTPGSIAHEFVKALIEQVTAALSESEG